MRLSGSMLFCLCYVRLVRPVFIFRCECCVTVPGWKCQKTGWCHSWMKTVMIHLSRKGSPANYKDVRGYLNQNLPQKWIGRTGKEDDALMRWPPRSSDLTPVDSFFWEFVKDIALCLHSPLISRFSQPYHRCCGSGRPCYADTLVERDGLSHRCLPYYWRWKHWASVKYVKKNLESFSHYRRKNYHDPLSSLFFANF